MGRTEQSDKGVFADGTRLAQEEIGHPAVFPFPFKASLKAIPENFTIEIRI
jgi:hypothetical protein